MEFHPGGTRGGSIQEGQEKVPSRAQERVLSRGHKRKFHPGGTKEGGLNVECLSEEYDQEVISSTWKLRRNRKTGTRKIHDSERRLHGLT